jgi:homogentisate 1,2-dioxygenase
MITFHRLGTVPAKHHIALRRPKDDPADDGSTVYYEHCITRGGFDGPYSILYRRNNPAREIAHEAAPPDALDVFRPVDSAGARMHRHHFATAGTAGKGNLWQSNRWLLGNADVRVGTSEPTDPDTGLVQIGDGDVLLFIHHGSGTLDSEMGRLAFRAQDYVWIPRGVIHRIVFDAPTRKARGAAGRPTGAVAPLAHVMVTECAAGLHVPKTFMNPVGQLKMDAPYSARDFRRPDALSKPGRGKGPFVVLHKRADMWTTRTLPHHPFDVVGWDGCVYPVAFNVKDYQPKTGLVHLPPPIHTTFLGGGGSFVVCSFVPRKVDYHPDAIPCPYPHSSVDCDEILWYVEGNFTSRKGVGPGSISHHPAGIPHAPQPGRYEASMGTERTDELAVMIDTYKPLLMTRHALACEDAAYHASWMADAKAGSKAGAKAGSKAGAKAGAQATAEAQGRPPTYID